MSLKNINRENKEKLALKREGHSLINRIRSKGYSKDQVYWWLTTELGVEERFAHFGAVHTLRELEARVEALQRIFNRVPHNVHTKKQVMAVNKTAKLSTGKAVGKTKKVKAPKPPKKKYDGNTLPRPLVLKALEEMRRDRELRNNGIVLYDDDLSGPWPVIPPLADNGTKYMTVVTPTGSILRWLKSLIKWQ